MFSTLFSKSDFSRLKQPFHLKYYHISLKLTMVIGIY